MCRKNMHQRKTRRGLPSECLPEADCGFVRQRNNFRQRYHAQIHFELSRESNVDSDILSVQSIYQPSAGENVSFTNSVKGTTFWKLDEPFSHRLRRTHLFAQKAAKETSCCKFATNCGSAPWLEPVDVWRMHDDIPRHISQHTDQDQEQLYIHVSLALCNDQDLRHEKT